MGRSLFGEDSSDLGRYLDIGAAIAIDPVEIGDLAHPGELAAGVVARALLHQLNVATEQLVEAERYTGGPRRPPRLGCNHLVAGARGGERLAGGVGAPPRRRAVRFA